MSSDGPRETSRTSDHSAGYEFIAGLQRKGVVCPWCFSPMREYHPDYEESLADHLLDTNNGALRGRGHDLEVDDDGVAHVVLGDVQESSLLPGVVMDDVPPTVVEETNEDGETTRERRRGGRRAVCSCGVVDLDPNERRDKWTLYEAVENLHGLLSDRGTHVDQEEMIDVLESELDDCRPGNDRELLGRVIDAVIKTGVGL